jgi:transcription initiation factor TFIID TATA-box-binding protein
MTDVMVENIIAHSKIANELNIHEIAEKLPEFKYNPDKFLGLTIKLEKPDVAVLLLKNGKTVFTGAKKREDIENAFESIIDKIEGIDIKLKKTSTIVIQNIIASIDLKKEINLDLISKGLSSKNIEYKPEQFPGLVYKINENGASSLIFNNGKIVFTGFLAIEEITDAVEIIKEKLSSVGVL